MVVSNSGGVYEYLCMNTVYTCTKDGFMRVSRRHRLGLVEAYINQERIVLFTPCPPHLCPVDKNTVDATSRC